MLEDTNSLDGAHIIFTALIQAGLFIYLFIAFSDCEMGENVF